MTSLPKTKVLLLFSAVCLFATRIADSGPIRKVSSSISCFQCDSRNHSDPNCHDPFNPAMSKYSENCKVPKLNHIGVFPARFCIKVTGRKKSNGDTLMIRSCALESMDNQCGNFRFEGEVYEGCILTCDYDGCNTAPSRVLSNLVFLFGVWAIKSLLL